MSDTIKKTWTAVDGYLVFEITIVRDVDSKTSTSVRIFCRDKPENFYVVNIHPGHRAEFNDRFASGFYVTGYLRQQGHVHNDGVGEIGIFCKIRFGFDGRHDEQHFEGFIVIVKTNEPSPPPPPLPPAPPIPIDPFDPTPETPIISSAHEELFPYVYIRKWPTVSAQDLQRCFVQYTGFAAGSPPPPTLFNDLCNARASGRGAMVDLALSFINGMPPYQGDFVSSVDSLRGPLIHLQAAHTLVVEMSADPGALKTALIALFGVSNEIEMRALLTSPDYLEQLDRLWQSYFALIIILGYDKGLLAQLIMRLVTAHLLNFLFIIYPDPSTAEDLTANVLRDLTTASIILPPPVFPLPPAEFSPPLSTPASPSSGLPMAGDSGWIEPYAIGDLQMVRQRLLRYMPGEIAHIENVMRGEKKEIGRKRRQRQIDYQENRTNQQDQLANDASDSRNNLLEETRKAIAEKTVTNQYNNFQTTYGPPTEATLTGSWDELTQQGSHPGSDDVTRFARDILNKTVSRITHQINTVRGSSTLDETEETVNSTIDNSAGDHNLVCVFRWLNKVYEARVFNYGNRLMVEFMLRHPAAGFIAEQQELNDLNFSRPHSLKSQGITSFKSITAANYAELAAEYAVTDITPPPAPQVFVTAALRSGEEKLVAIPIGYCASAAYVNFVEAADGPTAPTVLVGRETFTPGDNANTARTFGEDTTMPIAVAGYAATLSPPQSESDALVTVVIACRPSDSTLDGWRIKTYNAILTGYQKQLSHYATVGGIHEHKKGRGVLRSSQAAQAIERRQLKHGCMQLLLERFSALTGAPDFISANTHPDVYSVNEPRYIQFFDELFEWDEMTYRFYNNVSSAEKKLPANDIGNTEDAPFTAFLKADMARVMLPAQPSHIMALLYFLSTGMLWDGDNRLAPVSEADIAIVNDLKTAGMQMAAHGHPVGNPWEVIVPTAMQVIDNAAPGQAYAQSTEESK